MALLYRTCQVSWVIQYFGAGVYIRHAPTSTTSCARLSRMSSIIHSDNYPSQASPVGLTLGRYTGFQLYDLCARGMNKDEAVSVRTSFCLQLSTITRYYRIAGLPDAVRPILSAFVPGKRRLQDVVSLTFAEKPRRLSDNEELLFHISFATKLDRHARVLLSSSAWILCARSSQRI